MSVSEVSLDDPEAFGALYNRTYLTIFRFLFCMLSGDREEAEDITCETYIRAWKNRHHFHGNEDDALRWLFTISRHLVIDAHRWKKRHAKAQDVSLDEDQEAILFSSLDDSLEKQLTDREQFTCLWKALQSLPDNRRELVVLRYILGWQVKEIATYMRKKENTVSVNIRRCMDELRNHIIME
jgi:RNA polymerase sigma-70 factor (ECF subfamily)